MRLKKIIKTFELSEENRRRIILGAAARLNPDTYKVQLKEQTDYSYLAGVDPLKTEVGATWRARKVQVKSGYFWLSTTYGNGLFVSVVSDDGNPNKIVTSPDGVTWTSRTTPTTNTWTSVTYGNGLFVVVGATGTNNRVMTSPDGITWTTRTSAADVYWRDVTYGNGLFVAIAWVDTNAIMTSPDGVNWILRSHPVGGDWSTVAYGNGLFAAASWDGAVPIITSPDGINWTSRTAPAGSNWNAMTYGNGTFVVVAWDGPNVIMTSTDGITWTPRTAPSVRNWTDIAYGDGKFIAVSSGVTLTPSNTITSPDGITWVLKTSAPTLWASSIAYGNGTFVMTNHDWDIPKTTVYTSTRLELTVKTWVTNPGSCRQWLGFEATGIHYKDEARDIVTSFGFRLSDGTNEYWWTGSAWQVDLENWNTESDVANNISSFPFTSKKIQIIINLFTTDTRYTPELKEIKVLYSSNIEFQEDIIFRSLVPLLKSEIQPITDFPIDLEEDTSTIDLKTIYELETPYDIVGIDSVFDHTADPEHWTDLYQSYDSNTQIITLSQVVSAGNVAWVRFTYRPLIAVTTDQEYYELDKLPSVLISDIDLRNEKKVAKYDWVANKSKKTAVLISRALQKDIFLNIKTLTANERDQTRLADEMKRFFANNKQITSIGLDEKYDIVQDVPYDARTYPGQKGIHTGNTVLRIVGVLFLPKSESDVYIVTSFNRTYVALQ